MQPAADRMTCVHRSCVPYRGVHDGKQFQDAGLRDLCIESGVLAEGSMGAVMERRQYNREVISHTYEALMRLAWRGFACWLERVHPDEKNHLEQMLELSSDLHEMSTR